MPLLVDGTKLAAAPRGHFDLPSSLHKASTALLSSAPLDLLDENLIQLCQKEVAVCTAGEGRSWLLGSTNVTTCHILVLRDQDSGATGLGHFDGADTSGGVSAIIAGIAASSARVGKNIVGLDCHVVGGFCDPRGESIKVFQRLFLALHALPLNINLRTACVIEENTDYQDEIPVPILYGAAVDVATGQIFRANFPPLQPCPFIRQCLTFAGITKMNSVYDEQRDCFCVGPFSWDLSDISFDGLLQMDDHSLLQASSTSPDQELPTFVPQLRGVWLFLQKNSHSDAIFPDGKPLIFHRNEMGLWQAATQGEEMTLTSG